MAKIYNSCHDKSNIMTNQKYAIP